MRVRNDLTAEYIRDILLYEPMTGHLYWEKTLNNRGKRGKRAGCSTSPRSTPSAATSSAHDAGR